jgi:hypothetical protein
MKSILKHSLSQPFILATAIAAFLHSTWTVSTLFGGLQPEAALSWQFLGWLLPGVLLAFSLDIGLLSTANKLARGENVRGLRITFFTLAGSMYFLQWAYIVHHIPALALSNGVRAEWQPFVTLLRDMAVWVIPALLPVSVTLYTFSAGGAAREPQPYKNRDARRAEVRAGMDDETETVEAVAVSANGKGETERPFLAKDGLTGKLLGRRAGKEK